MLEKRRRPAVDGFGFMPGDYRQIVRRYTITNKNNAVARLISLGAGIQSISVPNKNGERADVVLGFEDVSGYLKNRYIGRIVDASELCADTCGSNLPSDLVNWDSHVLHDQVVMSRASRGRLVQVSYRWMDEGSQLRVEMRASGSRAGVIELRSCCMFNLAGHAAGPEELRRHVVTVNAEGPARRPTPLAPGYARTFRVGGPDAWAYRFHARVLHPTSGRSLEVYSNHPALGVYLGEQLPDLARINPPDLDDSRYDREKIFKPERGLAGKDGMLYGKYGCFAFVPQGCPSGSSSILYPGKVYVHDVTYDFGVA